MMGKRQKLITMLGVLVILQTTAITAFANDTQAKVNRDCKIIREDVSHEEAIMDQTYDLQKASRLKNIEPKNASWKTWGVMGDKEWVSGVYGAAPIGYSKHINSSGQTLNTYHYTRTYLGLTKWGDSGRVWGYGEVRADGKHLEDTVWNKNIHYVKYGTEE